MTEPTVAARTRQEAHPQPGLYGLDVSPGPSLWGQIPTDSRPVPFLLGLAELLIHALVLLFQARFSQPQPGIEKVEGGSPAVVLNRGLLVQIVQNYNQANPGKQIPDLEQQIAEYLDWVAEMFGTITLRGIEEGERQVVMLPLDSVYVPLQAECQPELEADFNSKKRGR